MHTHSWCINTRLSFIFCWEAIPGRGCICIHPLLLCWSATGYFIHFWVSQYGKEWMDLEWAVWALRDMSCGRGHGPSVPAAGGKRAGGLTAGGRDRPSLRCVAAKQRTGCKLEQGSRSRYEERSQCNGAIDQDWGDAVMAVLEAFKAQLGQPWATCFGFSAETALSRRLA